MTPTVDGNASDRRIVVYTVLLAVAILAGVVLFALFWQDARPLLELGFNLTTTTTT